MYYELPVDIRTLHALPFSLPIIDGVNLVLNFFFHQHQFRLQYHSDPLVEWLNDIGQGVVI